MIPEPFPPLLGGQALLINKVPMEHQKPADDVLTAGTTTATVELGSLAGCEFGIWEMSLGSMQDVEVDEIFVVIAGHGRVLIEPFNGHPARTAELLPGTIMRLEAGMRTTWTITEALRKAYFTPSLPPESTP